MDYTFEEGMKRLEAISTALEQDTVLLNDMIQLYKEGMKLSKELSNQLDMMEKEIQVLEGGAYDGK